MTTESDLEFSAADVKRLRVRLGETQAQFAKRIGVHRQTVSDWESGRMRPTSGPVLGALARMHDEVSIDASRSAPHVFDFTDEDRFYESATFGELAERQGVKPWIAGKIRRASFWPEENDPADVISFLKAIETPTET